MDSRTLRRAAVFHAVAHTGGITAAGRQLGKSPPAVHADLRRFERDVGAPLTERVGRSLRLTATGRHIFDAVSRALGEIDRACATINEGPACAPLRLGAVTGFGRYRLMPGLLKRLPVNRQLIMRTDTHDALLAALAVGAIDLALTYRPVVAAPLATLPVATEAIVLVGAHEPSEIEAARQGRLPFVTYDEFEYVFGRWFADAAGAQPPLLRRHDHFSELEEALASVAAGRGATIAPLDACRSIGLVPAGPSCRNTIHLCGSAGALETAQAQLIIDSLGEALGSG